ncbi:Sporulation and spore germination [Modestobacter sp. DSM 44400]|uniref:GerMN domain-containing protein n=1 Tax=Modestobacter sp. DSM 44400 TaxID=1550230 RepID=UPI0008979DAD|nr:GerMN domain-containing protein [Modestobacter sp. DSM 44400]SDY67573.1 Sporulation and spore germination [Modestobacter sp. DSM 44400]
MTAVRRRRLVGTVLTLAALTAGCSVPTGGAPEPIAAADVPYGLASPTSSASATPTSPTRLDQPRVYLIGDDGALVPRGRDLAGGTLGERLDELLADLASGPTATELTDQLSTALHPDTTLSADELTGTTVTIDLGGSADAPTGEESKRAVGQIVLTATSLPGIEAVLLTRSGQRVDAPLPSGQLTSQPLASADYASLLTPTTAPPS